MSSPARDNSLYLDKAASMSDMSSLKLVVE